MCNIDNHKCRIKILRCRWVLNSFQIGLPYFQRGSPWTRGFEKKRAQRNFQSINEGSRSLYILPKEVCYNVYNNTLRNRSYIWPGLDSFTWIVAFSLIGLYFTMSYCWFHVIGIDINSNYSLFIWINRFKESNFSRLGNWFFIYARNYKKPIGLTMFCISYKHTLLCFRSKFSPFRIGRNNLGYAPAHFNVFLTFHNSWCCIGLLKGCLPFHNSYGVSLVFL